MPPTLASLFTAVLVITAVLLAFAWSAWHVRRQWGARGLWIIWAVGSLAVAALMAVRVEQQQAALGFSPAARSAFAPFRIFLPLWALTFGAQSWFLQRRGAAHDSPGTGRAALTAPLSASLAWRSVAAGFGGASLFLLAYLVADIAGALR